MSELNETEDHDVVFGFEEGKTADFSKSEAIVNFEIAELSGLLNLIGGKHDDYLVGDASDNEIDGGAGNDVLVGRAGKDKISGGEGNDKVYSGTGDDKVTLGAGDDIAEAGAGNDVVRGNDGDDFIRGQNGNDTLYGNNGADYITGGAGKDVLSGGAGNDYLSGGKGADKLYGASGADIFAYKGLSESVTGAADFIGDFQVGSDVIDLSAITGLSLASLTVVNTGGKNYTVSNTGSVFEMNVKTTGGVLTVTDIIV